MKAFAIDLNYLSREELVKLRNKCLKQKFNKKTRAFEDSLDEELFLTEYVQSIIKGWKGLKYKYLEEFLLVDVGQLNPEDELDYTQENAELLMRNSGDFDQWVTDTVGDLENFTQQVEQILALIKRSFKDTGIDIDKYLAVCEQLNQEPDPEKMPPSMDSFPLEVQEAFFLHRMLSDRWDGSSGFYMGKDISAFGTYLRCIQYNRPKTDTLFFKTYRV